MNIYLNIERHQAAELHYSSQVSFEKFSKYMEPDKTSHSCDVVLHSSPHKMIMLIICSLLERILLWMTVYRNVQFSWIFSVMFVRPSNRNQGRRSSASILLVIVFTFTTKRVQIVVDAVIHCGWSPAEHPSSFGIRIFSLDLLHVKGAMMKRSDLADSSSWEVCKLSDEVVMEEGLRCSGWCAFSPTQRLPAVRRFPLFSLLWGCIPLAQGLMVTAEAVAEGPCQPQGPCHPLSLSFSLSLFLCYPYGPSSANSLEAC